MKNTHYNSSNQVLFITDSDTVNLNNMLNAIQFLSETDYLPENLKILESASLSTITFNENDLPVILEFAKNKLSRFSSVRHAVVHSEPINTAFAIIMSEKLSELDYVLMVFSKEKDALQWLTNI